MALEISPFKEKVLEATLLTKCDANWKTPTTVLRLLSPSSVEYCAFLTDGAIASAISMEPGRIYRITVPAKTVKRGDGGPAKYFGIRNDVTMKFRFPLKFSLVPPGEVAAFSGSVTYAFVAFSTLDQAEDGSYVDLLGRVTDVDKSALTNSLPKQVITVCNGDFYETLEFLGERALMEVAVDDVLACKGLMLKSWKGTRTCSTTLLTYVAKSPAASVGTVTEASTGESPKKKATMARNCPTMTALNVLDSANKMKSDYERAPGVSMPSFTCMFRGRLLEITMDALESAPIFEKDGVAKVRFPADLVDGSGTLKRATVWDNAAREMLKVNGSGLLALWEGCDEAGGEEVFLRTMNAAKDTDYDFVLEVALRKWMAKYTFQINVNAAHVISEA